MLPEPGEWVATGVAPRGGNGGGVEGINNIAGNRLVRRRLCPEAPAAATVAVAVAAVVALPLVVDVAGGNESHEDAGVDVDATEE